jgi:ABC-type Zn2+ transport system substrate-binding protein/surface adhesin
MAKKPKVTTLDELREAVESIKGNANAKKFLTTLLEELGEEGQVSIEHGDIKGGVAFLDYSEEDEDQDDQDEDEDNEDEEDNEEDEDDQDEEN